MASVEEKKERHRAHQRHYREVHPAKVTATRKAWREANAEELRAYHRAYVVAHRAEKRAYRKDRQRTDPKYRINKCMSGSMGLSLNGQKNGNHWEALVDYTLDDLMSHLEQLFEPGMTFENHGQGAGKWNIDHKIPIAAFNFEQSTDFDFKLCWALSNLQPMWAIDNLKKSDRLEQPFQASLMMGFPFCL